MRAKFINEKFTEDSDPISDMGIGIEKQIQNFIREKGYGRGIEELNKDVALCVCAEYGKIDFVRYLLEKGADVHAAYDYPIRYAITNGHKEIVELLLKQDSYNNIGTICLRIANDKGYKDIVEIVQNHIYKKEKLKENLNEKFTEDSDPISDLGIGGIRLADLVADLMKKFNISNVKEINRNKECRRYWLNLLKEYFIGRKVIGIFARGNENHHTAFIKYTTPEIVDVQLEEYHEVNYSLNALNFALITNEPYAWRKTYITDDGEIYEQNRDEVWYYYSFSEMANNKRYTKEEKYIIHLI